MTDDNGTVTTSLNGNVLTVHVDRSAKMNGFTPEMFDQLADALTELEKTQQAWVGVLTFAGDHTTAGLDLPRFAGSMREGSRATPDDDRVDAFAIRRRCTNPGVMAVQGVCFTIGIEMMLGVDMVVAADETYIDMYAALMARLGELWTD